MVNGHRRLNAPRTWNRAGVLRHLELQMRKIVCKYVQPGDKVIDYGCGEMPYRPLFKERKVEYIGCDIDGDCDIRFEPGQPVPLADSQADIVLSNQVLEHVWDTHSYLNEIYRLLKDDGVLCLSTHGYWLYHAHPDDYFRWTRVGLEKLLHEAGFELLETIPVMNILNFASFVWADAIGRLLIRLPLIGKTLAACLNLLLYCSYSIVERIATNRMSKNNSSIYIILGRKSKREK